MAIHLSSIFDNDHFSGKLSKGINEMHRGKQNKTATIFNEIGCTATYRYIIISHFTQSGMNWEEYRSLYGVLHLLNKDRTSENQI